MLLSEPHLDDLPGLRTSEGRRILLEEILAGFRLAFSNIEFVLFAESSIINAQAIMLGSNRQVRLYGGLAFHPAVCRDGLIFILLHETGHHLASGCRLPWTPWLACECVADRWATNQGIATLRIRAEEEYQLAAALREIDALACHSSDPKDRQPLDEDRIDHRKNCWAANWETRKKFLLRRSKIRVKVCPLSDWILKDMGDHYGHGAGVES